MRVINHGQQAAPRYGISDVLEADPASPSQKGVLLLAPEEAFLQEHIPMYIQCQPPPRMAPWKETLRSVDFIIRRPNAFASRLSFSVRIG